jgi:hypothetical protein
MRLPSLAQKLFHQPYLDVIVVVLLLLLLPFASSIV